MSVRIFTLAGLALAALTIGGCGGGDDSAERAATTTAAPKPASPTKEEFVLQANAICAEVNAAVGGIEAGGSEVENSTGQVADLYVGMVESLRRLGIPQDAEGYEEMAAAADELSEAEGEVKLAVERGDGAVLATAESNAAAALASFRSAAQAYGLQECGEGPSAPSAGVEGEPSTGATEAIEEGGEEAPAEEEAAPEEAPETGGAGTGEEGGGTGGGGTGGGGTGGGAESGGGSGGIGPG